MKQDLVDNAADVEQVKRAGRKERTREEQRREDLAHVMGSRPGRRLVRRWLANHGLYRTVTAPDEQIYVLSGRRDAGLEMLAEVVQLDELYLRMETEARDDARRDEAENEAARTKAAEQEP